MNGSIGRLAEELLEEVRRGRTKTAEHTLLKEAEDKCLKTEVGLTLHKLAMLMRSSTSQGVSQKELEDFVRRTQ